MKISKSVTRFLTDETAATSVEYAVMVAAILLAVIIAVAAVGLNTNLMYEDIQSGMESI